ncbi:MAG: glycosyltransferase family 4 protein [bacterium]|nr:glycosyltransferase family 4 protein [bacterium]
MEAPAERSKILILTQKVDRTDTAGLGFFHSWIEEFARRCAFVTVICLEKGVYNLPANTKVLSLGKEEEVSRLTYLARLYRYIWRERENYDAIFVHMNQEYVLLAGLWWKLAGKRVLMWRNHRQGTWRTSLAGRLSHVVFYTSPDSFTAKFRNARRMPTGIDLAKFRQHTGTLRIPHSILSIGRVSRVKRVGVFIEALLLLEAQGVGFTASVVGDADPRDTAYYDALRRAAEPLIQKGVVMFQGSVPNTKTPEVYAAHEVYVNLTESGSLDKTIFSAMTSGTLTVVTNEYFRGVLPDSFIFKNGDATDLAHKLQAVLDLSAGEKQRIIGLMKKYVDENHSLEATISGILQAA